MNTKNGEIRAVPITLKAYELLKQHSKVRKINSDYVFARKDREKPLYLRYHWEEVVKNAKL